MRPKALGLSLGLGALVATVSWAQQKTDVDLQRDLSRIQRQRNQTQQRLRETRREAGAVRVDLNDLDSRMTGLENRLHETENDLARSRSEQERLKGELDEADARLESKRVLMRNRLRGMYVRGNTQFVSGLLGSDSFGDLASRKFLMDRVARQDRKEFDAYASLLAEVSEKKTRADALVGRIEGLIGQQRQQHASLEETRGEKAVYLRSLRGKESELKKVLAEYEADEAAILNQIAAHAGGVTGPFTGKFIRPVSGRITSGFGMRFHPILKVNRLHAGIDFGAPTGTPIKAAAAGTVISATHMRGYGNTVILDHGGGYTTVYAHCSRIYVSKGMKVAQGQRIAAVGSTGLSTGPHLHFEIRLKGKPINPASML